MSFLRYQPAQPTRRCRPQVESLESRLTPAVIDLTSAGAEGMVNDALFRQTDEQPTGTGVISSFLRLQTANANSTVEEGYNTDVRNLDLDQKKSANFTRSLQLGEVPLIAIDGSTYREFLLDINQKDSASLLSLDELRLYVGDSPGLSGYDPVGKTLAGLSPVYDLDSGADSWLLLDASLNSGSGSGDLLVYIPQQVFAGATADSYLYLYCKFGDHASANAGFEEWAVREAPEAPTSSISGFVYHDADNDGIFDADEAPIAEVLITLTGIDDQGQFVTSTAVTSVDGAYQFAGLRAGVYSIAEIQPAGFFDGQDSLGTVNGEFRGDNLGDLFDAILLLAGEEGVNYNFGEVLTPPQD